MRFDDSLKTVLASDMTPGVGARTAWRQLVDLVGRGRVPADAAILARLRELRALVPEPVRAATARALAAARPEPALVALFAEDDHAVAAPLLRDVELPAVSWEGLLPRLTPALRAVLRARRDLPAEAVRGLEGYGVADFVLEAPVAAGTDACAGAAAEPAAAPAPPAAPLGPSPFVPLGEVARGLPVVAEAIARSAAPASPDFPIPELVARIEAFQRTRAEPAPGPPTEPSAADRFTFDTDERGTLVAAHGVPAGALVGLSLAHAGRQGSGQVDGAVAGAFRRRSRFADARLEVGGEGPTAGSWRLTAVPAFDRATGRFTGYRGVGRRPRADETASPERRGRADSLRQLVHELRTPANAITGFAELIELELMGPVPPPQRRTAAAIRGRATDLLTAIDDLDTAARIDGGALELRPGAVALLPLLGRVLDDLAPLAALRGGLASLDADSDAADVLGDGRALERLVGRLLAVLVAAASPGERLGVGVEVGGGGVRVLLPRPAAWTGLDEPALLSLEADGAGDGAPLLGTGFCLRLARNLAAELGGALTIGADRLTLRLPPALSPPVEHATTP